jgi:REP element-mobilizing transposase RayT
MSRQPRVRSETGLYHITFRGINKQNIFEEDKDYHKLMELLFKIKKELEFKIYAYTFMPNHVHLLFQEKETRDSTVAMHKLLTSYAGWYNKKYARSDSLFGDRFASKPVEEEKHLFSLVRYIHQNPIRAGIVSNIKDYRWSSFQDYLCGNEWPTVLTDTSFLLSYLSTDKAEAIQDFIKLHHEMVTENYEIGSRRRITAEEIRTKIMTILNGKEPHTIASLPKHERNSILRRLRYKEGFSIRQIERATGISRGIISRIW